MRDHQRSGDSGLEKVNLSGKFRMFKDYLSPKIVGELNDSYVKLVKVKGQFVWHKHVREDELFFVTTGRLIVKLRDRNILLKSGEFFIVPRGIEHKPVARGEAQVVLIERKTTLNTGQIQSNRTVRKLERI